ncbi:MAG: UDP-glucose/GDP-mannose dehydrogenase family protein [Methanobrevibacter woesei]|nr:UDP-glucose/GDP-mannose dehydrogenase family protein [Methanobrevibacter woesei]
MKLTIIGTGYVGLVTGTCFAEMGNKVYCVDIDEKKINDLKNNIMPIYEPNLDTLVRENQEKHDLIFTTDLKEALDDSNIIFLAVGTPMMEDGSANLDYIYSAADNIGNSISKDSLVVIKSTVPIGTTFKVKEHIEEIIASRGLDINIDIASNPEFLKEGVAIEDCMHPDRVIIGAEKEEVFDLLKDLYAPFVSKHDRIITMDVKSSEMTKYVANSMLATKISFMNEIANICEVTGANVKNVRIGIGSDKRIGYDFIYAGCGYGGSCFPKDVQALINTSIDNGYTPELLNHVEIVNANQKKVLVNKVVKRFGEDLSGLTFSIWGLAFKPGTDDVREAPSIEVIKSIIDKGGKIRAYDPKAIETFKVAIDDSYLESIEFVNCKYDALNNTNALILVTEWKEFRNPDFEEIAERLSEKIIFDGRNIFDSKIKEEGFELYQIGC